MLDTYGPWGAYNDTLAGPAHPCFLGWIADLAGPGSRVLECGVGSGRLAVPLSAAGYDVTGIDSSAAMLELLSADTRARGIHRLHGDFATHAWQPVFDIVLLAYNVLSMQVDTAAQQALLVSAAAALRPGGHLVLENLAPRAVLTQVNARNQAVGVQFIDDNPWLYLARYFPDTERYKARWIAFEDGQVIQRNGDTTLILAETARRYAEAAGLRLVRLAGDWDGAAFTTSSDKYVMAFQRPGADPGS